MGTRMRMVVCGALVALLGLAGSARAQTPDQATRRQAVLDLLRAPRPSTAPEIARVFGAALRELPFDAIPVAYDLLSDDEVGSWAAYAMLGADEQRALRMVFESIPASGPNTQRIAFTWFLDRYTMMPAAVLADARTAALRTLEPVRSTANAEAALYILGLAGSTDDVPVLEFFSTNFRTGSRGMRDASLAALVRLGSPRHVEQLQTQLTRPATGGTPYEQGLALASALQRAAFSAQPVLVPAVCGHVGTGEAREFDVRVDIGRVARLALNAIVDRVAVTHLSSGTRTPEQWAAYCAGLGVPSPR